MKTYDCPSCGAEVEWPSYQRMVFCPECGTLLELDVDAEFENGMWRDLSRVIAHKPEPAEL